MWTGGQVERLTGGQVNRWTSGQVDRLSVGQVGHVRTGVSGTGDQVVKIQVKHQVRRRRTSCSPMLVRMKETKLARPP